MTMTRELVQVRLRSGTTSRTCWVENRVKQGDSLTLKNSEDPSRWWDVMAVDSKPTDPGRINRGWNNNI